MVGKLEERLGYTWANSSEPTEYSTSLLPLGHKLSRIALTNEVT